jgi:hypothetical protein
MASCEALFSKAMWRGR